MKKTFDRHPRLFRFFAITHRLSLVGLVGVAMLTGRTPAQSADAKPYKILNTGQKMGAGGIDYVYADNDERRLYVPRGGEVLVFNLDTLESVGAITEARARGVAVDSKSHHGFCSSSPVVMWDTKTLKPLKKIDVQGRPDAILFEPLTECVYVLSHSQPNATVIDARDGSVKGTIDLGGAPEQGVSDGKGHIYIDIEDKDNIAVVDAKTMKVTAHYDLAGKGGGPAGLGFDAKNRILFAMCHDPQTCVVLSADDGKIITTLPIGKGTDNGGGDGTLTIIKETSPTTFEVEQTVQTKPRAKTCTLDTKNNHIVLICTEPLPAAADAASAPKAPEPGSGKRGHNDGPAMLDILIVGR